MINPYTHFTFIDLSLYPSPVDEMVKVIRKHRNRLIGVVSLEEKEEEITRQVYIMLLKSTIADSNSAVAYHLNIGPSAAGQKQQVLDILGRNQIKIIDALPDPPHLARDKEKDRIIRRADGSIDKNPRHEFLERKIKELSGNF